VNDISEGGPDRAGQSAREELRREILEAAILTDAGRKTEARQASDLLSRAELRAAAVRDTAGGRAEDRPSLSLGTEVTKQWVTLDVVEYTRYRAPEKREAALSEIASNARHSPEYAAELPQKSMPLATAAAALNFAVDKEEVERRNEVERVRRQELTSAQQAATLALIDANAMARVGKLRQQQSQAVLESAGQDRSPVNDGKSDRNRNDELAAGVTTLRTPAQAQTDASKTVPEEPTASDKRAAKRPIGVEDVPDDLRRRYLVTIEGAGLIDRGRTEFSHRGGRLDGQLAFADSGRQLVTTLDDQATARAMLEVAQTKGWKQVTLNGSDEFKRAAWMEARLQGMEVHGYEPREADKKRLAELLVDRQDQRNSIGTMDRDVAATGLGQRGPRAEEPARKGDERPLATERATAGQQQSAPKRSEHVDGDKLTERESKTLEGLAALMRQKGFDPEFVNATTQQLESRMRSQRVHVGELTAHGPAPYKNDEKKDMSYFVTLKTAAGEQTVWGKRLGEAISEGKVQVGDQIVLTNTGKKPVTVEERGQDDAGRPLVRDKDTQLNAWTAQSLVPAIEREGGEPKRREPTLMVYDRAGTRDEPQRTPPVREPQREAPGRNQRDR
jgi:Large polyvalent protein-associated domain 7